MAKKFRVCKAGQTTNGREITVQQIQEMAESYNPTTYGARVNIEHSRLYKFKAANVSIHSCIDKKSKRCWLFEKPKDPAQGKSS